MILSGFTKFLQVQNTWHCFKNETFVLPSILGKNVCTSTCCKSTTNYLSWSPFFTVSLRCSATKFDILRGDGGSRRFMIELLWVYTVHIRRIRCILYKTETHSWGELGLLRPKWEAQKQRMMTKVVCFDSIWSPTKTKEW